MSESDKKKSRIAELEKLIKKHQELYYNSMAEISDGEFDRLWDELAYMDPENQVLKDIGKDKSDGFLKAAHILPMGSQAKAADPEEFLAWANKQKFDEFVTELKLDGASLELQYEKGFLAKAVTRGDGVTGDDITANARQMNGVVPQLPEPWSGAVRGEVLMSKAVHKEHFSDKANCRNAANGLMKRKDGAGAGYLDVICYDAAPLGLFDMNEALNFPHGPEHPFDDETEKLKWLASCGFMIVEYRVFHTAFEVIDYRAKVVDRRESYAYDIDGLVVKAREPDIEDMKRLRPDRQIAFKFPLEEAASTLLGIEWSESGANYTPVALIEPVRLAGTTVKRASLANAGILRGMGLKIGAKVAVVKRGDIIPKIEGMIEDMPDSKPVEFPELCSCLTKLVDDGTRLFCPNPDCPKKALHRLEKWISVLGIMEFGTTIIKRLFDSGRVKKIADLYSLKKEELAELERLGDLSAAKLVDNLEKKSSPGLAEFVAGFDIEGIGVLTMDKLVKAGFNTLEKLRMASVSELEKTEGLGNITAANLKAGMNLLKNDMDTVLESGRLVIKESQTERGKLSGMSFCFTGELSAMKRSQAQALVKANGGIVKSSVAKDLSYLVSNDSYSGSEKNRKAKSFGIKVIDEKEFLALLS